MEVLTLTDIERTALHVVDAVHRIDDHYLPIPNPTVGDAAYLYSRGKFRRGIVSKVTKTRVEVTYTTEGAIRDAIKVRDLVLTGRDYYHSEDYFSRLQESEREVARAKAADSLAAARRGEYVRWVNFTRKTVKREALLTR